MNRLLRLTLSGTLLIAAGSLRAQTSETAPPSEVRIGGDFTSVSGDRDALLQDIAARSGPATAFDIFFSSSAPASRIKGVWTSAGEGALRIALPFEKITVRAGVERLRRWSDTSIGAPTTSAGSPLADFYPGDNTTRAAFGLRPLVLNREAAWLDLTMPLTDATSLVIGGARSTQRGDLGLVSRGTTFGDSSTLAFNTPAVGDLQLGQTTGFVRADYRTDVISLGAGLAAESRDDATTRVYPNFGSASLLDMYDVRDSFDTTTTRADIDGTYDRGRLTVIGAWRWQRSKATPSSSSIDQGSDGSLLLARSVTDAHVETTGQSTALAAIVALPRNLTLRLTASGGHRSSEGEENETRRDFGQSVTAVLDGRGDFTTDRWGAKADLSWVRKRLRARLGYAYDIRDRSIDSSRQRTPAIFPAVSSERVDRRTETNRFWARLRMPLSHGRAITMGGELTDANTTTDLVQIENNYVTGDRSATTWRVFSDATLAKLDGSTVMLRVEERRMRTTIGAPLFDPLYDPSLDTGGVSGRAHLRNAELRLVVSRARYSISTSGGWRDEEQTFATPLAEFAGFAPTTYHVRGESASVAGSLTLNETSSLEGDLLWVGARNSVANNRLDGRLAARHDFSPRLGVEAALRYVRFDDRRFATDDYRGKIASLVLISRF